jgi:hypothetical protein
VSARDAIRRASKCGVRVFLEDDGTVLVEAANDNVDDETFDSVLAELREQKSAIEAYLLEFKQGACATDVVLRAQELLRDGVLNPWIV